MNKRQKRHLKRVAAEIAARGTVALLIVSILTVIFSSIVKADDELEINIEAIKIETHTVEPKTEVETKEQTEVQEVETEAQTVETKTQTVETEAQTVEAEAQTVETEVQAVEAEAQTSKIDEADVMLLASLMHEEEGVLRWTLSYEDAKMAHLYAGSVVLNRLNMHYRGAESLEDVIYCPGQYASVDKLLKEEIPEETIEWARQLLQDGPIGPENMIYQAEFEQGSETVEKIGNQYFCCE